MTEMKNRFEFEVKDQRLIFQSKSNVFSTIYSWKISFQKAYALAFVQA